MYDQLNADKEDDPNENYNILHSIISNSINENCPSKIIKFEKNMKANIVNWLLVVLLNV